MIETKYTCDICKKEFTDERWNKSIDIMAEISKMDTIIMKMLDKKFKDVCEECNKTITDNMPVFQKIFNEAAIDVNVVLQNLCRQNKDKIEGNIK